MGDTRGNCRCMYANCKISWASLRKGPDNSGGWTSAHDGRFYLFSGTLARHSGVDNIFWHRYAGIGTLTHRDADVRSHGGEELGRALFIGTVHWHTVHWHCSSALHISIVRRHCSSALFIGTVDGLV